MKIRKGEKTPAPLRRKMPKGYTILAVSLPYVAGIAIGYHLGAGDTWWLYVIGLALVVVGVIVISRYNIVIQRLIWDLEEARREQTWDQEMHDIEVQGLHRLLDIRFTQHRKH